MFNGKLSLSIKTKILSTLRSPTVEYEKVTRMALSVC